MKAVRNGNGVATVDVIFDVEHEGADAANLKAGGADAADGGTGRTKITELCLDRGHGARGLTVDADFERVGVPGCAKVSTTQQSSRSG